MFMVLKFFNSIMLVSREEKRAQISVEKCNKKEKKRKNRAYSLKRNCLDRAFFEID